jgi:hypothetical protein
MAARVLMCVLMAAGVGVAGCSGADGARSRAAGRPEPAPPGQLAAARLVSASDCSTLLNGLREATAGEVGPYGLADGYRSAQPLSGAPGGDVRAMVPGAAPAPTSEHSTTNVQEAGVDEPDVVKTDGRRIIATAHGKLYVVDAASHRVTGTLDLAGRGGVIEDDLLLAGNRVLIVQRLGMAMPVPIQEGDTPGSPPQPATGSRLTLVDISGAPRVVSRLTADGFYVDARQVGSIARVAVRSIPRINFPQPRSGDRSPADRTRANQDIVRKAPLESWLPTFQITRDGRTQTQRVPCDQVSHPPAYTGTSLLSVLTADLSGDLGATRPVSVVAGGQTVYATAGSLYVTDVPRHGPVPIDARPNAQESGAAPGKAQTQHTDIYKFDIRGSGRPRYVASGAVPGDLLNQYSLSEYGGNLRVATTTNPIVPPRPVPGPPAPVPPDSSGRSSGSSGSSGQSPADQPSVRSAVPTASAPPVTPQAPQSSVHVLTQHGDRLDAIGRLDGLGTGERIFAVRFVGPTGYVVTFRQVDPLYVLDLRDARKPRTAGQLEINGYSAYLHPAGNGLLIGVGQDATSQGRTTGTQVSLFDVRDPAAPRRLSRYKVESGTSEVEFDPHAFLYRPDTGLTVLPVQQVVTDPAPNAVAGGQALVLSMRGEEVRKMGTVRQPHAERHPPLPSPPIRRSLTIGTTLWTMSDAGLQASDAATLTGQAWVPLS